jgi:hypothetical protein
MPDFGAVHENEAAFDVGLLTLPVVISHTVALFLPPCGTTSAALESRRASSGFCQRCLRYSKRGRAAHPFLHHTSGRRAKDSASKVLPAKSSLQNDYDETPHAMWGFLVSYPLSAVPISSVTDGMQR